MLPLAAFGPGHWRNTTLEANEQLVALLARMVPPGTRRQTEVDLSVDLTDALGRVSAPQPAGGAVDVAAQLHEAPIA
jgi:hypothetical protein